MVQSMADKIREMKEYVEDIQVIATILNLDRNVVEAFLIGEIDDEILEGYNLVKPPEIKIVEQKRFIRSRSIGIISTNNTEGSLLTSYLAANLAKKVNYEIAVADFNELPLQSTILGVNSKEFVSHVNFLLSDSETFDKKGTAHPILKNLALFMASTGPISHQQFLSNERTINLLHNICTNYSVVFVDCPVGLPYWNTLVPNLDFLIIGIEQNVMGLSRYRHIYNYLETINVLDRSAIILICTTQDDNLSLAEIKKAIRTIGELPVLGTLPYEPSVKKPDTLFKNNRYEKEIINILKNLFPEVAKERKKGLLEQLVSNFNLGS